MQGFPDTGRRRVWIELDVDADSIAGTVHRGEEPVRPFTGWLELVAVLEAVRRPPDPDDP
jgi:hypothetical protein